MIPASRKAARSAVVAAIATTGLLSASGAFADVPFGPPSLTPATGTPHLVTNSATQYVRQLVQCGGTMYAVGTITQIAKGSTKYTRGGAFSFSATSPFKVTSWDPEVNGTVNTIGFNGTDCSVAYLGGKFTQVGSTTVKNLAAVSTTTGQVLGSWKNAAGGEVQTIAGWNGHLLVGGKFAGIGGSNAHPYFASLNPATGKDDGYLSLGISGNYVFTDDARRSSASNATQVYNQQLSPDGTKDLIEGVFTTVGGQPRRQVAIIDLNADAASTDAWYAPEFDANCYVGEPFYAQAGAWAPDGQTVYFASTGYKPSNGPAFSTRNARAGLCDAAAAFPTTSGQVSHLWVNYTGCDSLYAAAADASTAYFAGHERYASNGEGCDGPGRNSVAAPGMVGLSPTDGSVTYNPTRDRGLGADDLEVTSAGLWVASDNNNGSNMCGHVANLAGICFLPYGS
ncbi:MAG: hypothetical protein JO214_19305 [Frankiaceae bacterium]|nr:hypothetical protein [Frankiaceae bacterium]